MSDPQMQKDDMEKTPEKEQFLRFDIFQRIEHLIFLLSFSTLGLTGLIQKFAMGPVAEWLIKLLGGIETVRVIHRTSAVVMMVVAGSHVIDVLYRIFVHGVSFDMIPSVEDFKHLFQDILFYFNQRKKKASYGRYNYAEKVEYFAVVWGTIIMGITGFMMWNPIATTKFLPGEFIPAAKAAHGGEAILAVLAIILWHFYNVHLRHFNKSIFTGVLNREEMEDEHPTELARILSNQDDPPIPAKVIQKRQRIFTPVAIVLAAVFGIGIFRFTTLEETAIKTIPPGESVQVFVLHLHPPQVQLLRHNPLLPGWAELKDYSAIAAAPVMASHLLADYLWPLTNKP
jgi:cytochrome b subunit of formate dehydrogenase